jgi:pentatricopeptide repeat protein
LRIIATGSDSHTTLATPICNSVIEALLRSATLSSLDKALHIFEHMKQPNVATFNALIAAAIAVEHAQKARSLLNTMLHSNITPNLLTYRSIATLISCNQLPHAAALITDLLQHNAQPIALVEQYAIACIRNGAFDDAISFIIDTSAINKLKLGIGAWNQMIETLCQQGKIEQALQLTCHMEGSGVRANVHTYAHVVDSLLRMGEFKRAQYFTRRLIDGGGSVVRHKPAPQEQDQMAKPAAASVPATAKSATPAPAPRPKPTSAPRPKPASAPRSKPASAPRPKPASAPASSPTAPQSTRAKTRPKSLGV